MGRGGEGRGREGDKQFGDVGRQKPGLAVVGAPLTLKLTPYEETLVCQEKPVDNSELSFIVVAILRAPFASKGLLPGRHLQGSQ